MDDVDQHIALASAAVQSAVDCLAELSGAVPDWRLDQKLPKEVKSSADRVLEEKILTMLAPSGLPGLTEESGEVGDCAPGELRWVIDPLDGTANYVRGIAPCAVSIALCRGDAPIAGVIGEHPSRRIAWGGPSIGSFSDGVPLRVSKIADRAQ